MNRAVSGLENVRIMLENVIGEKRELGQFDWKDLNETKQNKTKKQKNLIWRECFIEWLNHCSADLVWLIAFSSFRRIFAMIQTEIIIPNDWKQFQIN